MNVVPVEKKLTELDLARLRRAYDLLEYPSFAARLAAVIGTPMEIALRLMPDQWYRRVHAVAERSIAKALDSVVATLPREAPHGPAGRFHTAMGMVTGAVGGAFGLPGLLLELPITTSVILRCIADTARHHGEDLSVPDGRLACMEVFALGGRSELDDAADTGYYGVRLALAFSVSRASRHIAERGLVDSGAPLLARVIAAISSRFGVVVSEKTAVQLMPLVGAAAGATINTIFIRHFQAAAEGHFTVRELERRYGSVPVRDAYEALRDEPPHRRLGSR